jgi:hypothetical protein
MSARAILCLLRGRWVLAAMSETQKAHATVRSMADPRAYASSTPARYMDRTPKAVRHMVEEGKIPGARLDSRFQVRKKDIDEAFEKALI